MQGPTSFQKQGVARNFLFLLNKLGPCMCLPRSLCFYVFGISESFHSVFFIPSPRGPEKQSSSLTRLVAAGSFLCSTVAMVVILFAINIKFMRASSVTRADDKGNKMRTLKGSPQLSPAPCGSPQDFRRTPPPAPGNSREFPPRSRD